MQQIWSQSPEQAIVQPCEAAAASNATSTRSTRERLQQHGDSAEPARLEATITVDMLRTSTSHSLNDKAEGTDSLADSNLEGAVPTPIWLPVTTAKPSVVKIPATRYAVPCPGLTAELCLDGQQTSIIHNISPVASTSSLPSTCRTSRLPTCPTGDVILAATAAPSGKEAGRAGSPEPLFESADQQTSKMSPVASTSSLPTTCRTSCNADSGQGDHKILPANRDEGAFMTSSASDSSLPRASSLEKQKVVAARGRRQVPALPLQRDQPHLPLPPPSQAAAAAAATVAQRRVAPLERRGGSKPMVAEPPHS